MNAVICAILAGVCWGVGEIFTKWALNTGAVGPMTVQFVRSLVTVPLTLTTYLVATQVTRSEPASWWRAADVKVWMMLILGSGVLAGFAGVFFFYLGLGMPGGDISRLRPIAFALAPATAVVLGWLVLHEAMTVRKAVAVVLIVVGIALLAAEGHAKAKAPATIEARGL